VPIAPTLVTRFIMATLGPQIAVTGARRSGKSGGSFVWGTQTGSTGEAVAAALDDPTAEEDVRGVVAVRIELTVD
jgi:hypothetical protein